jgi:hypothetical protein
MASLYNDRFAFIHVPKTGGTWATTALRASVPDLREPSSEGDRRGHFLWNELPQGVFRFGFVRDPASWYRSHWTHKKTHEDYAEVPDAFDQVVRASVDFPSFVRTVTTEVPGFLSGLYELFLGPPGAIEYIGRYENLVDDLIEALGRASDLTEADYEKIRQIAPVNTGNTTAEITPDLREMIAVSEQQVIERFGY